MNMPVMTDQIMFKNELDSAIRSRIIALEFTKNVIFNSVQTLASTFLEQSNYIKVQCDRRVCFDQN